MERGVFHGARGLEGLEAEVGAEKWVAIWVKGEITRGREGRRALAEEGARIICTRSYPSDFKLAAIQPRSSSAP